MSLTSAQNPLLKKIRQASESGRPLDDGCVVAEGPHLLAEALHSRWMVRKVLATSESAARFPQLMEQVSRHRGIELAEVSARALHAAAGTEHSQGILALLQPRVWDWPHLLESGAPLVILDVIQDPGNAGTILRSAEAFGAGGVVFCEGSVRAANGKLLRASAGSLFRLPFLEGVSIIQVLRQIRESGTALYALAANRQSTLDSVRLDARVAFIVGSESAGVRPEFLSQACALSIPTANVESLNAAVACSIALFEAARQRSRNPQ